MATDEEITALEEEEKQLMIRMDRIMKMWLYWNESDQRYIATIVQYITDKSRRSPQRGVAKKIADFVVKLKLMKDTEQDDDTRSKIVACFIKDRHAYLACNYFVETTMNNAFAEGWGDKAERSELKEKILEKFEGLADVHFVEPTNQGHVMERSHSNKECHAEMQLLALAKGRGWNDVVIRINKAPCMFCIVELWRWNEESNNPSFKEDGGLLEADATVEKLVNWVPPSMIQIKVDGEEQGSSKQEIEDLKESLHSTIGALEQLLGVKGNPKWNSCQATKTQKEAMEKHKEEKCQEIREANWEDVPDFPGVDEAVKCQEAVTKTVTNLTKNFGLKKLTEFQKLKVAADEKERIAFELKAKCGRHRGDLMRKIEALRDDLKKEVDKEEPNVPRHKILSLGNSLYVDYSEEAFDLFMTVAKKVLGKDHWKIKEVWKLMKKESHKR